MTGKKEEKYKKEVEELKRMNALTNILNRGIAENTILNSTSRDDEPSISNISDRLLTKYEDMSKGGIKDLEMIERMTTSVKGSKVLKEKSVKVSGKKTMRNVHMLKKNSTHKAGKAAIAKKGSAKAKAKAMQKGGRKNASKSKKRHK